VYRGPVSRPQLRRRLAAVAALATLTSAGSVAATASVDPGRGDEEPATASATDVPSLPEPTTTAPIPEPPAPEPPTTPPASEPPNPAEQAETADDADAAGDAGPLVRPAPSVYAALRAGSPTVTTVHRRARAAKREPRNQPFGRRPAAAAGVFWLHHLLPNPTPPSLRLDPTFARRLRVTAKRERVDWALVLAVLRARGRLGAVPAGPLGLDGIAVLVADAATRASRVAPEREFRAGWTAAERAIDAAAARREAYRAILARISRNAQFEERAVALALYYRAVGLRALQRGLAATKPRLARRLLSDARVDIYAGGRGDVEAGRIDIRVLTLIAYLTATYGQVTVSSLETGHGLFSRPGAISAHAYGRAVDVTALAGVPILAHQQPESITADAVRAILLLPTELLPRQVISLLGFGGPSFPLADHYDHIHVGY
jgi:hypothetical protein